MLGICVYVESYVWQRANDGEQQLAKQAMVMNTIKENKEQIDRKDEKVAYLTFDDGPSENTKRVLQVLKSYGIHATFFLIGSNICGEKQGVVKQMIADGNVVGVHTYSHKAENIYSSVKAFEDDFKKAEYCITSVTGKQPILCRFPWGSANDYLKNIEPAVVSWLDAQGYYYCDWNVSAEDSVGCPTEQSVIANIQKDYGRYKQPVILLHDSSTNAITAKMLPNIIVMIKNAGYRFDTLDHMESPYQYPRN